MLDVGMSVLRTVVFSGARFLGEVKFLNKILYCLDSFPWLL